MQRREVGAQIREAEVMLAKTVIRSPIAGTVLRKHKNAGESVSTQGREPVVTLGDTRRLHVRAEVDETEVARLATGQRAWIAAAAYGERRFAGKVIRAQMDSVGAGRGCGERGGQAYSSRGPGSRRADEPGGADGAPGKAGESGDGGGGAGGVPAASEPGGGSVGADEQPTGDRAGVSRGVQRNRSVSCIQCAARDRPDRRRPVFVARDPGREDADPTRRTTKPKPSAKPRDLPSSSSIFMCWRRNRASAPPTPECGLPRRSRARCSIASKPARMNRFDSAQHGGIGMF